MFTNPVLPSEYAMRQLIRSHEQQRTSMRNLRARLGTVAVRRHQGGYSPPGWVPFRNTSGESVPRWGVMRITGASEIDKCLTIAKPSSSFQAIYLINMAGDVPANGRGFGSYLTAESFTFDSHKVLYNTANTPAYGDMWGPVDGAWTIAKNNYGFGIVGGNVGSGSFARTIAIQMPPATVYGKPTSSKSKDATDATVNVWDRAFAGVLSQSMSSVIVRVRDMTTATRISVDVSGNPPVAFPIDCEDA